MNYKTENIVELNYTGTDTPAGEGVRLKNLSHSAPTCPSLESPLSLYTGLEISEYRTGLAQDLLIKGFHILKRIPKPFCKRCDTLQLM